MRVLVIRHAEADGSSLKRHIFGKADRELSRRGWQQAALVGQQLRAMGIEPETSRVATSEQVRTRQTALGAGFAAGNLVIRHSLNEIVPADPNRASILRKQGKLPPEGFLVAQAILEHPPEEPVWFTHGTVIAGLRAVLGEPGFIPELGEVVGLDIDSRYSVVQ